MIDVVKQPGKDKFSTAERFGELLREQLLEDEHFYFFSPDETTSNKLSAVYDATGRAWNLPEASWDLPEAADGRVVELLSENVLFAAMVGHILNGEPAMLASYEAFLPIITSQIIQHCKFLTQCEGVKFRPKYPAVNLLSTSTCWRQDHNGFSHQSPALISTLLARPDNKANCLFPVDDVAAGAAYEFMNEARNVVNLATFNKSEEPRWIDSNHAHYQYQNGASVFDFASHPDPNVIFTAAGDIPTREALEAIKLLKKDLPEARIRFVGIAALSYNAIGTTEQKMKKKVFNEFYTTHLPIIANFHGYAGALEMILLQYADRGRLTVHGFRDQGATTTPFEMLAMNGVSRYDLAMDVAKMFKRQELVEKYQKALDDNRANAMKTGM